MEETWNTFQFCIIFQQVYATGSWGYSLFWEIRIVGWCPITIECKDPDSKVRGANMGPIWGRQDPCGPHVGPMNFAVWGHLQAQWWSSSGTLCLCMNIYIHGLVLKVVDFLIGHYTYRIFPPAIDIIPTLLAVVYSNGKYTN